MMKQYTIVLGILMVLLQTVNAEEPFFKDVPYFEYVRDPINPHLIAMGGAGTALSVGGYSYYNPAGAAFSDRPSASVDFGKQWDLSRGSVEVTWMSEKWFLGGTVLGRSVDYLLSDETGVQPGSGSSQETMLSIYTGLKKKRYAIGVAGNVLTHFIGGENALAFTGSGGISMVVIPEKLSAGVALLHAGRYHRGFASTSFESYRDSMATTLRIGAALEDTILSTLPVTVAIDGVFEQGNNQMFIPVGIEVRPIAPLAVRIGKRFNHDADQMTFGIGLAWENIIFNAAFVPTSLDSDNQINWCMGLQYTLATKNSRKREQVITTDPVVVTPAVDGVGSVHTGSTAMDTLSSVRTTPAPDSSTVKEGDHESSVTVVPDTVVRAEDSSPAITTIPGDSAVANGMSSTSDTETTTTLPVSASEQHTTKSADAEMTILPASDTVVLPGDKPVSPVDTVGSEIKDPAAEEDVR